MNIYARENGWAISGLIALYDVTNDPKVLAIAEKAGKWVNDNRALPDGGFRHGDKDRGGPYLGDTMAMGQAFLDLYAATGNRDWLYGRCQGRGLRRCDVQGHSRRLPDLEDIGGEIRRVRQAGQTDR